MVHVLVVTLYGMIDSLHELLISVNVFNVYKPRQHNLKLQLTDHNSK